VDTEKSTHQMVEHLHARFGMLEQGVKDLHVDHNKLRDDFEDLRGEVRGLESRADTHEQVAVVKLERMSDVIEKLQSAFAKHAEREETDRRVMFIFLMTTLASAIGTLFVLLFKVGGLA